MKIEENIELAPLTTFKIGGKAKYFCVVKSTDDIKEAIKFVQNKNLPVFVLGGGSNLLVSDNGFSGLVIKNEIKGVSYKDSKGMTQDSGRNLESRILNHESTLVSVGAGENWDEFVKDSIDRGLWGIENLSGVPGTVGATPIQNIGAYGQEVKDSILSVETVDLRNGKVRRFENKECDFSYRHSFFKTEGGKNYCVTRVTFKLSKSGTPNLSYKDTSDFFKENKNPTLQEIRRGVISIRSLKFPDLKTCGTAGSFWKNPIIPKDHYEKLKLKYPELPFYTLDSTKNNVKVPLAYVLDKICGLKGYEGGGVRLYEKQPLVVVTKKGTASIEVRNLNDFVHKKVKEATSIDIEEEVGFL